jgi:hypothetical protein
MNNSFIHIRNLRVTPTWCTGTKLNRINQMNKSKVIDLPLQCVISTSDKSYVIEK